MMFEIPSALQRIVEDVKGQGGESYLVGGAVIDMLQDRPLNDWDIEVHRLSLDNLEKILLVHGTPNLVGNSFGVIKLYIGNVEYDFSIPRKEIRVGPGHKDFDIELVPDISLEEAAKRRDLTINSMYFNLDTRVLVDPYYGKTDLDAGILRHTSERFSEDALRVLRIMQILPRKGKSVAPETVKLCREMLDEYGTLKKERVFEEWVKLLMKPDNPSLGLNFLVDSGWIFHYPELDALRTTPQHPEWHPEGDVWTHTLMVVDCAAKLRDTVPEEWRMGYMFGLLLHDVGKPYTTAEDFTAYGHDEKGIEYAKSFLERFTNNKRLTEKTLGVVKYHLRPGQLYKGNARESAWRRLHNKIPLNVISQVSRADSSGRGGRSLDDSHPPSQMALEYFEGLGKGKIQPALMGRHLIKAGYEPGRAFGPILGRAYEIQIESGITDPAKLLNLATK